MRLVTLIGPAGTGKTRLGLQVAAEMVGEFAAGVCIISLESIIDADLVAGAIGQELGLQEGRDQTMGEMLKDYLHEKQILLVVDNFEQVMAAAPSLADLLATCVGLKILVTSREVLHLQGEHDVPVPPLSLPSRSADGYREPDLVTELTQFEAVRLFIDRGVAVLPSFRLNRENAPAVAEICHRLDGLPLAIELAAARIRLLPPQKLLERLVKRLPLLTRGAKDRPTRQQTLRIAIAWSFDLLDEEDRVLFRRLAVFAGGFTLEAAEEVCGTVDDVACDVLDGMVSLEEQSLMKGVGSEGEPRFAMLETIREFAEEHLAECGETEAVKGKKTGVLLCAGIGSGTRAERSEPGGVADEVGGGTK